MREIANIKTVRNRINDMLEYETIPTVNDKIGQLFTQMELKFPNRI